MTRPAAGTKVQIVKGKGYNFSKADRKAFVADDEYNDHVWTESRGYPLFLVVTVTELQRRRDTSGFANMIKNNIWTFDLGDYRVWLHAMAGAHDADGHRVLVGDEGDVFLNIGVRGFGSDGERIKQ